MSAIKNILGKLRRAIKIHRVQFFEFNSPSEIVFIPPKIEIEIARVTSENVDRVRTCRDAAIAAMFRRFLDEGQYGIYALVDRQVVGHVWAIICRGERCMANGYIEINKDEAAIHFGAVADPYRGKRIFQAMMAAIASRLFDELKVHRIVTTAGLGDRAATRGHEKVGFKPVERMLCVQIGRRLVFKKALADADAA